VVCERWIFASSCLRCRLLPSNGQTGTCPGPEVLAAYYFANKEFKKQSTRNHYDQIVNGIPVPRWGKRIAVDIRPVEVKHWFKTLEMEDSTCKYRSVIGVVYTFGQSEGVVTLDGKGWAFDLEGNKIKRFGFHVFRHSLCLFLMAEVENPAAIQAIYGTRGWT
jgi:hypothetical protein